MAKRHWGSGGWLGVAMLTALALVAAPSPATAQRPMYIIGSTHVAPYVGAVVDRIVAAGNVPVPRREYGGTVKGVKAFCRSAAPDTPSVLAMSRRMLGTEFEDCRQNGVSEIIDIQIGYGVLVLAAVPSDRDYDLTLAMLYRAITDDMPTGDDFAINRTERWSEIDERLPDTPIRVLLPAKSLGSRGFFDGRFLEAACRDIPAISRIFSAESRMRTCLGMRDDGVVVEIGAPFEEGMREAMRSAPEGTIGVMPYRLAVSMPDIVKMLPLDGVTPTVATIGAHAYPYVRPLFVYVKKPHVKNYRGDGPVTGLRELISELTHERAIGSDGYLARRGLVPMEEDDRREIRARARRLTSMSH